jgi:hypothetical protein
MRISIAFSPRAQYTLTILLALTILSVSAVALADIISGSSSTGGSLNVTITKLTLHKPASVVQGDLMLASIAVNGGSPANITAPSGWTLILRTDNDTDVSVISYWKVATASEPASYTWSADSETRLEGGITQYRGVNTSNPIDASAGIAGRGTVATTAPLTTTGPNEETVAVFAFDAGSNNGGYFSTPTGMTEKYDVTNAPLGPSIAADNVIQAVPGNSVSKTSSIKGGKQREWVAQQIALRWTSTAPSILDTLPVTYQTITGTNGTTFTYTVPSGGTNKMLVTQFCLGGGRTPTVTQNGVNVPLTQISGSSDRCLHWYGTLANPTSGTFSLTWTGSSGGTSVSVMTLQNVNQSDPIDVSNVTNTMGAGSISTSVTTTQGNDLLLDEAVGTNDTITQTYGTGQTQTHPGSPSDPPGQGTGSYKSAAATPGTETMTRIFSPNDNDDDLSVIAVKGI